jgi:transposase
MKIITVGIDLAKSVFAVHGIDERGKAVLVRPSVRRDQLLELVAALPPCVIGMEACSGAHHWARAFAELGHTPRLMAPKFVAPYRMSGRRGKNDAADCQTQRSWVLCIRCDAAQLGCSTRMRSRSSLARPYIWRFRYFNRLI